MHWSNKLTRKQRALLNTAFVSFRTSSKEPRDQDALVQALSHCGVAHDQIEEILALELGPAPVPVKRPLYPWWRRVVDTVTLPVSWVWLVVMTILLPFRKK